MLARSTKGITVANTILNATVLRRHLRRLPDLTNSKIDRILRPTDPQNTQLSVDLVLALKALESLPTRGRSAAEQQELRSITLLAKMLNHFIEPFININFSLSDQLKSLSTYAHTVFAVYQQIGDRFMPPPVYNATMERVKHVTLGIQHAQVDQENDIVY